MTWRGKIDVAILRRMQTYDVIMLVVLGAATAYGAWKGLVWQVASLASILASYFFAFQGRTKIGQLIHAEFPWHVFLGMLVVYLISHVGISLVFRLISDIIDRLRLRDFDRHLGALAGFIKGAIVCILATLFAVTLLGEGQRRQIVHSFSGRYISRFLHDAGPIMPAEVKGVLGPYLENFERQIDADSPPASTPAVPENPFPNYPASIYGR